MAPLAELPGVEYRGVVDTETRRELEATGAARRGRGPGHDDELIAAFLERIEKEIDRRVEEQVAKLRPPHPPPLNPATLALCIPIVAIAGGIGHTIGLVAAFA